MTGQSRHVNQRTSRRLNWLGRFQPRELHQHLLRGSHLDRSTLRREFEQLHQAWPWSGLARFGPTTPKRARARRAGGGRQREPRRCTTSTPTAPSPCGPGVQRLVMPRSPDRRHGRAAICEVLLATGLAPDTRSHRRRPTLITRALYRTRGAGEGRNRTP